MPVRTRWGARGHPSGYVLGVGCGPLAHRMPAVSSGFVPGLVSLRFPIVEAGHGEAVSGHLLGMVGHVSGPLGGPGVGDRIVLGRGGDQRNQFQRDRQADRWPQRDYDPHRG
jgi:hypothetical protein